MESLESPTFMIARLLVLPPNHRAVWFSDECIYHPDDRSSCVYVFYYVCVCACVYCGDVCFAVIIRLNLLINRLLNLKY